jgi:hypothetical protein
LRAGQRIPLRFMPREDGSLPWYAGKTHTR